MKTLKGTWELSSSISGLNGQLTSYPQGNGTMIKYSGDRFENFLMDG